jgi:hypothetical protein
MRERPSRLKGGGAGFAGASETVRFADGVMPNRHVRPSIETRKKGAHGGNMVSPVLYRAQSDPR